MPEFELDADTRAFPYAPPADLDDPCVIVEHDWQAFLGVERMINHWDRPGWSQHTRAYYWMLTPATPDLARRVEDCQRALEHLGMDPVPVSGLHVTVIRIGTVQQVSSPQLRHLIALVEQLPLNAFRVVAHPLAGSRGAIRCSLSPWRPIVSLHSALSALGHQVGVPGGKPTRIFRPHLGIAYNSVERAAAPVVNAVSGLRSLPPVPLAVSSVELVELHRRGRAYLWETIRSIPLRAY